jgi:hypothetical protein
MENELGMSLSEEAFDRSFIGVPAMIKAFYNYAVLGNKAPETLAKGVIGEGGRLLDKAMFARWTAAPARLAYEELTGSMAFSPADREKWEGNAIQAAQTRIKNVKFLLARKWLMAVNERAVDPGHGMRGLLEKYLNWPQNVEIRRELAVIAAYAKALKKSSDTEAKKIVELVEDGAITPTGGLGELSAVEVWIKDDVIAQMDEMLKDYGPDDDIAAEEGIRELKKEIEAGKAEYSKWMAEYQRLVKEKKSDIELAVRLTAMENEIMKAEEGLQTLVLSKRQLDATRVELARLKALN